MRIRIKPLAAGIAVGAAVAAGSIVAIDASTPAAEAQGSAAATKAEVQIVQRQNIRAIKQLNTYSQFMKYLLNPGQIVGVNSNAPNQARGVGGGWPVAELSDKVQENFPYWVQIWHANNQTFWVSRGATNVERQGAGNYLVTWGKDVEQCSSNITLGNIGTFNPPNGYGLAQSRWAGSSTTTRYRTWEDNPAGNALVDRDYPMTAQLVCNDATATNLN